MTDKPADSEDNGIFTTSQKMMSQHLYALLYNLPEEQRKGAVLALSSLTVIVEDGFSSLNAAKPTVDFYTHCYDTLVSAAIALHMIDIKGVMPKFSEEEAEKFDPLLDVLNSEALLKEIEQKLQLMARPTDLVQ